MSAAINTNTTGEWDLVNISQANIISDMIEHVQIMSTENDRSDWSVFIADEWTLRILGSFMRTYDITEHNIIVIENLTMKRQPLPEFPAIYFVRPTMESVNHIVNDFIGPEPIYQSAHIYFTSPIPDDNGALLSQLARIREYVGSLYEANVDYLPIEPRAFHLGMETALKDLYSRQAAAGARELAIQTSVERMATFCLTFGEYPLIRYENASSVAKEIALRLKDTLDRLMERGRVIIRDNRRRSEFVIAGRSVDIRAPVLSEFTYQAMAQHLLKIEGKNRNKYTFVYNGTPKNVLLDEKDDLWVKFRHHHIADVSGEITEDFNEFTAKNVIKTTGGTKSFKELSQAIRGFSQYAELMSKYSLHIGMAESMFDEFKKRKLVDVAAVEQDYATGWTDSNDRVKADEIVKRMTGLLYDPGVTREEKIRLIMLWIIFSNGTKDSTRDRIMDSAQLTPEEKNAVESLFNFGVTASEVKDDKAPLVKSFLSKLRGDEEKERRLREKCASDVQYNLSRYTPKTKEIFTKLVDDTLLDSEFPYANPPQNAQQNLSASSSSSVDPQGLSASASSSLGKSSKKSILGSHSIFGIKKKDKETEDTKITTASSSKSYIMDLIGMKSGDDGDDGKGEAKKKKYVPNWAKKPAEMGRFSESDFSNDDARFVIFIAGGMTYSEMRTAYEASEEKNVNCYIGATEILTPQGFVEELKKF